MSGDEGRRIGVTLMSADIAIRPDDLAREAEARGFESVWFPEHSHIPVARSTPWPGSLSGEPLPDEYARLHDAVVALAMAAAVTERIRLGTSVALVAQRDPIWTAKQVATLDHLSGGRVELGVGFGWNREEMAHHGVTDFASRWAMTGEKVAAMRALWCDHEASFTGEHVAFGPSWAWPKPIRPGGPKIHLGGGAGPRLLGEVAAWADGWLPISARSSLRSRLDLLTEACERAGREPATVEVSVFGATTDPDGVASLFAEGVHRLVLTLPPGPASASLAQLDRWAGSLEM